jgi:hypothetical protein
MTPVRGTNLKPGIPFCNVSLNRLLLPSHHGPRSRPGKLLEQLFGKQKKIVGVAKRVAMFWEARPWAGITICE